MAKIISTDNEEEIEVNDGEPIKEACEKLGIPFACEEGICGTCMVDIIGGQENLSELTQEERDMGRDKNHRLACQCRIEHGIVKIKY